MHAAVIGSIAISPGRYFFLAPLPLAVDSRSAAAPLAFPQQHRRVTLLAALLSFVPEIWKKYV